MYRLEFDGLYRNTQPDQSLPQSGGLMCYGWVILKGKRVVARGHGTFAHRRRANSNTAEYLALIEGLEALLDMGVRHERVVVCGDAKSVIEQMEGTAGISSPEVRLLNARARRLASHFRALTWQWLPRKHNRAADALSRHAFNHLRCDETLYASVLNMVRSSKNRLLAVSGLRVYQPVRG